MNMWDTLHCECAFSSRLIPCASNPPKDRQAQKAAQKNKSVKRAAPVEILKPHPCKQEKITNARVFLRANDVRGAQMKSVTFAPLTSEVDD
jgi:hypothetical protein